MEKLNRVSILLAGIVSVNESLITNKKDSDCMSIEGELTRKNLTKIISGNPRDILNDSKKIKNLLLDLNQGAEKKEVNILCYSLEDKIPLDLIKCNESVPFEIISKQLILRLQNNTGITEELAKWSVETWAIALNIVSSNQLAKNDSSIKIKKKRVDQNGWHPNTNIQQQKNQANNPFPVQKQRPVNIISPQKIQRTPPLPVVPPVSKKNKIIKYVLIILVCVFLISLTIFLFSKISIDGISPNLVQKTDNNPQISGATIIPPSESDALFLQMGAIKMGDVLEKGESKTYTFGGFDDVRSIKVRVEGYLSSSDKRLTDYDFIIGKGYVPTFNPPHYDIISNGGSIVKEYVIQDSTSDLYYVVIRNKGETGAYSINAIYDY